MPLLVPEIRSGGPQGDAEEEEGGPLPQRSAGASDSRLSPKTQAPGRVSGGELALYTYSAI